MSKTKTQKTKTRQPWNRLVLVSIILFVTLVLDLVSKYWARASLEGHTYTFLGNSLVFEHSENPGAFLSLGANFDPQLRFWIFTVGIAAITFGVLYYLIRNKSLPDLQVSAYTLIVAGGFGNLVDRIQKETVTDFINMGIGSLRTGIFNVADMAIMLGVFVLIGLSFQKDPSQP
jgi:signal peptidase II